jgi:hypothetical protein
MSALFVADVQYNRVVGMGCTRAIAVGRAKFVNAGSLRVGDPLRTRAFSMRRSSPVIQLPPRRRAPPGWSVGRNAKRRSPGCSSGVGDEAPSDGRTRSH